MDVSVYLSTLRTVSWKSKINKAPMRTACPEFPASPSSLENRKHGSRHVRVAYAGSRGACQAFGYQRAGNTEVGLYVRGGVGSHSIHTAAAPTMYSTNPNKPHSFGHCLLLDIAFAFGMVRIHITTAHQSVPLKKEGLACMVNNRSKSAKSPEG